jgi:hypothetical protein
MKMTFMWIGPGSVQRKNELKDGIVKESRSSGDNIEAHVLANTAELKELLRSYGNTPIRYSLFYSIPNHPKGLRGVKSFGPSFVSVINAEVRKRHFDVAPKIEVMADKQAHLDAMCAGVARASTIVSYAETLDAAFAQVDWRTTENGQLSGTRRWWQFWKPPAEESQQTSKDEPRADAIKCQKCGKLLKLRPPNSSGRIVLAAYKDLEGVALRCQECGFITCVSCAKENPRTVGMPVCPSCGADGGPTVMKKQE